MKKHIQFYITVFSLYLVSVSLFAQRSAPGYMGKRFVLKYDQGISWSLGGDAQPMPNLHYGIQAEYTITTSKTLGLDYSFMPRYYKNRVLFGNSIYLQNFFTHRIGINAKLFRRKAGNIAPTGMFSQVGLNLFFINGQHYNTVIDSKFSHLTFDIGPSIGAGKQYIVGKNLMISVDVKLTLPLIAIANGIGAEAGGGPFGNSDLTETQQLKKDLNRKVSWPSGQANILVMKIGFGGVL